MSRPVSVILNPASGRGRGQMVLQTVRRAFERVGMRELLITTRPGDEAVLARRALENGATTIAVVGGDGTWSNVAHAILSAGADCRLAMLAAGTGNDFARSVGAPASDFRLMAELCRDGADIKVDVGRIEGRYFLNVAGFGLDAAVLEDVARGSRFPGRALYAAAAVRQLFRFGGIHAEVQAAGERWESDYLLIIVANARYFGGNFPIAPSASPTDGFLDAVAIGDASLPRRFVLFGAVLGGRHLRLPEVRTQRSPIVRLRFDAPPAFEADGEYLQAASGDLEITCVPGALRVVTG